MLISSLDACRPVEALLLYPTASLRSRGWRGRAALDLWCDGAPVVIIA
jgi:hypothetical protein